MIKESYYYYYILTIKLQSVNREIRSGSCLFLRLYCCASSGHCPQTENEAEYCRTYRDFEGGSVAEWLACWTQAQ